MKTAQVFLSVSAGKALIAKGLASLQEVQTAVKEHTVVIITGTTNSYLAKELLSSIGVDDFRTSGFYRGIIKSPSCKAEGEVQEYDVIISKGEYITGKTIYDVAEDLTKDDIVFKGANIINPEDGTAGILIGNPKGGTIVPIMKARIGKRTQLIHPVGVEKRTDVALADLAAWNNASETAGLRLALTDGEIYTELDAFADLFHVNAEILASGGVGGYEGACYFLIEGEDEDVDEARKLAAELNKIPPYQP